MLNYENTVRLPSGQGYEPRWSDFSRNARAAARRWAPRFRGFVTEEDLFSEAMERFWRCADKYGRVDDPRHFNSLFASAVSRRFTEMYRSKHRIKYAHWCAQSLDACGEDGGKFYEPADLRAVSVPNELRRVAEALTEHDYAVLNALDSATDRLYYLAQISGLTFAALTGLVVDE